MPFDFGPEAIQFRGYGGNRSADQRRTSTAKEFYDETRKKSSPSLYSVQCLVLPFAPFAVALGLLIYLENGWSLKSAVDGSVQNNAAEDLFKKFCASSVAQAATVDAVTGAVAHFAALHIAFVSACLLSILGAVLAARNVLQIHGVGDVWTLALVAPILAAGAILAISYSLFSDLVRTSFGGLSIIPTADSKEYACLHPFVSGALTRLPEIAAGGVCLVVTTVSALTAAAAALAYRYETEDIDGAWADTYVLRHKLKSLLTLFFLGSIVLVSSNIALSSMTNVSMVVLEEAAKSQEKSSEPGKDAAPKAASLDANATVAYAASSFRIFYVAKKLKSKPQKAKAAAAKAAAQQHKTAAPPPPPSNSNDSAKSRPPFNAPETLAQVKSLRAELLSASGVLGSLLLVGMFAPAFYSVTGDIQLAAKTHAGKPSPPAAKPPQPRGVLAETGAWLQSWLNPRPGAGKLEVAEPEVAKPPPKPDSYPVATYVDVQKWKEDHGLSVTFAQLTGSFVAVLAPVLTGGVLDVGKALIGG